MSNLETSISSDNSNRIQKEDIVNTKATILFEASVIGARHVQDRSVCQDAALSHLTDDGMLIVAVADGHGDKKHALSHIGSRLAVATAVELIEIALRDVIVQSHKNTFQIQKELQLQLPKRIHYEWKKRILEEISKDRTDDDSTEFVIEEFEEENLKEQVILYGTTLLAVGLFQGHMLCFQLGDGDIFILTTREQEFDEQSADDAFQQLIDAEQSGLEQEETKQADKELEVTKFLLGRDDLYGSLTYSLCQPNNQNMAQIYYGKHPKQGILSLSTDGFRDCVGGGNQDFDRVMRWIYQKIEHDRNFTTHLPQWIGQVSFKGNGDDISLVIVDINDFFRKKGE